MSIYCVGLCLNTATSLGLTEKFILLALCEKADNDGTNAWPSVKTLARYAECSERTVQRALGSLCEKKWITLTKHASATRPRVYSINLKRFSQGCQSVTPQPSPVAARGDTAMSPDPSSTRPTTIVSGLELRTFIAWWMDTYKEKMKGTPYQLTAAKDITLLKRLLNAYGMDRLKVMAELLLVTDEPFIASSDRGIPILSSRSMWLDHLLREHGR